MVLATLDHPTIPQQVHAQALRASIAEATAGLVAVLPRHVAAYALGVRDVKTLGRWARGTPVSLRVESERRLRAAYEIVLLLERFEAPETTRAWFLGMSPYLGDRSPAQALHEGRLVEALDAARSFVALG